MFLKLNIPGVLCVVIGNKMAWCCILYQCLLVASEGDSLLGYSILSLCSHAFLASVWVWRYIEGRCVGVWLYVLWDYFLVSLLVTEHRGWKSWMLHLSHFLLSQQTCITADVANYVIYSPCILGISVSGALWEFVLMALKPLSSVGTHCFDLRVWPVTVLSVWINLKFCEYFLYVGL